MVTVQERRLAINQKGKAPHRHSRLGYRSNNQVEPISHLGGKEGKGFPQARTGQRVRNETKDRGGVNTEFERFSGSKTLGVKRPLLRKRSQGKRLVPVRVTFN